MSTDRFLWEVFFDFKLYQQQLFYTLTVMHLYVM